VQMTEGFEAFVTARGDALIRLAFLLCGDTHDARDLVQEVLIKTHRHWDRVAATDLPEAYVRKILIHEHASWRRRWYRRNVVAVGDVPDTPLDGGQSALPDRSAWWQLLSTLPRRQRAVLVLRYYEGLSDSEIAVVLQCSDGTVRSHASRALATLRARNDLATIGATNG